jgi:hypothetical protein
MYIFIGLVHQKMVMKKNLWRNYAPKNLSYSLKSTKFVTRYENHHVTKLADQYGNSVTTQMHKGLGAGKGPK